MICKNCENNFSGNFCNYCGQKSTIERINFKFLINEIPNSIFQLNRGFLFTIKELFIRPGHTIREFLSGKRIRHYKPIAFLLITSTIYVVTAYLMDRNTFYDDMIAGYIDGVNDSNHNHDIKFLDWLSKYQAYIPLLILPIFSTSTYIAFSKSKYNYFEHLVINFYITGQQMVIYWILGFIFFKENILLITPLIIGLIYNFWSFSQLFDNKRTNKKIGLMILSYLIFIILVLLILITVVKITKILN